MVNVRTLRGLRAALLECVPGRAQRGRLLEALARVPGNRHVSAVTAWLIAREADSPSQRASAGRILDPPPKSGAFRTRVITYTQSPPEVQVTMSKGTAEALFTALDQAHWDPEETTVPNMCAALDLKRTLNTALALRAG